jgi:DMSO reductase family type II enzyme chaperone
MTAEAPGPLVTDADVAAALGRAALYRLLGTAFAYPDPERCGEIADLAGSIAETALPDARIAPALEALAVTARDADPPTVAAEHVFLFDRQVHCSPHEGGYGDAPQLAGKSALLADIAGFYTAFGLAPSSGEPEVEDHIVAELEFMSALAVKEAWALAEAEAEGLAITRAAQAAFLADHLGRWAAAFAEAMAATTPLAYYTAAAALLSLWVDTECKRLGVAPRRVAGRLGHDPMQTETFTCPMAGAESGEITGS